MQELFRDAIDGQNVKASAKRRFDETLDDLSKKAGVEQQEGEGKKKLYKKKKSKKAKSKKSFLKDIFA